MIGTYLFEKNKFISLKMFLFPPHLSIFLKQTFFFQFSKQKVFEKVSK